MSDWYKAYLEYLDSEEWKDKKARFKEDCHRLNILKSIYGHLVCEICHTKSPFEVHHIHYNTLGFESYEDLLLICNGCHLDITLLAKEKKVSNAAATFIIYRAYESVRYAKQKSITEREGVGEPRRTPPRIHGDRPDSHSSAWFWKWLTKG